LTLYLIFLRGIKMKTLLYRLLAFLQLTLPFIRYKTPQHHTTVSNIFPREDGSNKQSLNLRLFM